MISLIDMSLGSFSSREVSPVQVSRAFRIAPMPELTRSVPPVSRTATAPFDRLKIYLITKTDTPPEVKRPPDVLHSANTAEAVKKTARFTRKGFGHLGEAVTRIYRDGGGVRAFWVGNGLNVTKIFPVGRRGLPWCQGDSSFSLFRNPPSNSSPTNIR